tara:strand:- start:2027 stop:2182 length:156 start_codon:yes stop_codon:yes gene_type:complete
MNKTSIAITMFCQPLCATLKTAAIEAIKKKPSVINIPSKKDITSIAPSQAP